MSGYPILDAREVGASARPETGEITLSDGSAHDEEWHGQAWHEEVYRKYRTKVLRMLTFALWGDAEAAEELFQDTMMTTWQKRKNVPDGPKLEAWIVKTAKNHMLNYTKKKKKLQLQWGLDGELSNREGGSPPDLRIEDEAEIEQLRSLSKADRRILILVVVYGFSSKEAAPLLGIKPAAARQQLKRAKEHASKLTFNHQSSMPPKQQDDKDGGDNDELATQDKGSREGA